ncbi:branched-chain amino acid ABC transporter permease [Aeromicrobium terrae]|uniref:Branched-chain amino acid ABC transporter permease n=1 Tax=Aeromicrobium terrae TaxID=2498846 RepID=A0A5C8NHH4_9ACTN|nr:branched-chain amino acid ABC transporter permease [Aeromicrobium terrae]TXL60748.1 branched-chain amino acid ABC transporter permease [Aeromicrobium terrae]
MTAASLVSLVASAMLLGSVYSLVNLGVVLLVRTTGTMNFAQGEFIMLGAYVMSALGPSMGYWPGLLATCVVMASVGFLGYYLLMRFLHGGSEFDKVVLTFMLSIILTQAVIMLWGTDPREIAPATRARVPLLDTSVQATTFIAIAMTVAIAVGLVLFLSRSITGLRMRALSADESLAEYYGIRTEVLSGLAWAMAGVCAAVAGVIYAQGTAVALTLPEILLLAFPAAVLGGLESFEGAVIGSLVVAGVYTFTNYVLGGQWSIVIVYSLMLITLMVRPYGFFGRPVAQRL